MLSSRTGLASPATAAGARFVAPRVAGVTALPMRRVLGALMRRSDRAGASPAPRASATSSAPAADAGAGWQPSEPTYVCSSVTADSLEGMLAEIGEATAAGVDIIELRLDFLREFDPETHLKALMEACTIPYIVTFRPTWEG